jgi:hypothetical protein
MRRIATASLIIVVLFWTATPLFACVIPGQAMMLQARECCQHMQQMCGSAELPASHPCCKSRISEKNLPAVTSDRQSVPVLQVLASTAIMVTPQPCGVFCQFDRDHSPPKLFSSNTILRI